MIDKLNCEMFHAFDGKCCQENIGCACEDIVAPPMYVSSADNEIRGMFWRAVLGGYAVMMVALIVLAVIAINN